MLDWIVQNMATIVVCIGLLLLVVGIILTMIRDRKKGKSSCGGRCIGCPMKGTCHKKEQ